MKNYSQLTNVVVVVCCLILATSYFLPVENLWSPADAWRGYYADSQARTSLGCGDDTCQDAEAFWQLTIQQFFLLARTEALKKYNDPDTPLNEAEQRAYEISYELEHPISAALPEGCTP